MAERSRDSFSTTAWTVVEQAAGDQESLNRLLSRYWLPLRCHLVQSKRLSESDADDVLQEFLTARVLERNLLAQADRKRGKFRWFLVKSLNNFLIDRQRAIGTRKAAPERAGAIEAEYDLSSPSPAVDAAFEAGWALSVLAESVRRMETECRGAARGDLWEVFQGRAGRVIQGLEPLPFAALASAIGARDEKHAANIWGTSQVKFQRILRQVLADYGGENVEEDVRDLRSALGNANGELVEQLRLRFCSELPGVSAESTELGAINVDAVAALWSHLDHSECGPEAGWNSLLDRTFPRLVPGDEWISLRTLLQASNCPVEALGRIKDYAKDIRGAAVDGLEAELATGLYYVCIALGIKSDARLSDQGDSSLQSGFRWLLGQAWLDASSRAAVELAEKRLANPGR